MKTRWLFTMVRRRGSNKDTAIETEEHITAEDWNQAIEYWKIELYDLNTEIVSIRKQVPVRAYLPQEKR